MPRREVLADGIEIWHGDFREVEIPEVQAVICDPPYEQRSHDSTGSIRRSDGAGTPTALPFAGVDRIRVSLVSLAAARCTGWSLFFCTTEGVAAWRDEIEAQGLKYKTPMIWVKPDAMPKFNGQGPSHGHECIVTCWNGSSYSRWNGGGRRGVFTHLCNPPERDGGHPTEKPVGLMAELVGLFSNPGELVCDPCMGSGTTGIACIRLGRRFFGCELDFVYFEVAVRRLSAVLKQTDMFVDIPRLKQSKLPLDN